MDGCWRLAESGDVLRLSRRPTVNWCGVGRSAQPPAIPSCPEAGARCISRLSDGRVVALALAYGRPTLGAHNPWHTQPARRRQGPRLHRIDRQLLLRVATPDTGAGTVEMAQRRRRHRRGGRRRRRLFLLARQHHPGGESAAMAISAGANPRAQDRAIRRARFAAWSSFRG